MGRSFVTRPIGRKLAQNLKWYSPNCKILNRFSSSFSFRGPSKLDDIVKKEAFQGKSRNEVADIWYTYHEEKVHFLDI
jgi:hypothetical protein